MATDTDLRQRRGQRFVADPSEYPDLAGIVWEITNVRQTGDDVFVEGRAPGFRPRWFRDTEIEPAPALPSTPQGVTTMSAGHAGAATQRLMLLADDLRKHRSGLTYSSALKQAAFSLKDDAQAWRDTITPADISSNVTAPSGGATQAVAKLITDLQQRTPGLSLGEATERVLGALLSAKLPGSLTSTKTAPKPTPQSKPVSLSAVGEFDALTMRYAKDHGVGYGAALKAVGREHPALAAAR
jgi:hypothetical protein